jgi:hypothetical protein
MGEAMSVPLLAERFQTVDRDANPRGVPRWYRALWTEARTTALLLLKTYAVARISMRATLTSAVSLTGEELF